MPINCGHCDATWSGARTCHCGGCHESFAGLALFDQHRSQYGERGACLDPASLTSGTGERLLFHRDGMWRGPEMTDEQKAARFGSAA